MVFGIQESKKNVRGNKEKNLKCIKEKGIKDRENFSFGIFFQYFIYFFLFSEKIKKKDNANREPLHLFIYLFINSFSFIYWVHFVLRRFSFWCVLHS